MTDDVVENSHFSYVEMTGLALQGSDQVKLSVLLDKGGKWIAELGLIEYYLGVEIEFEGQRIRNEGEGRRTGFGKVPQIF